MTYLANGHTDTLPVPGRDGAPDPSGATVTFRADATFDDELELGRATVAHRQIEDEQERIHAFRIARTLLMVEGWTLTDREGAPLPLTEATLRTGLSRRVAAWIDEEATRRYEGREAADEGPFGTGSPQPSTATT